MENTQEQSEIKSDERMMAMFSHLSVFMGGIVLPIVFWAVNKDKSKFASFHALQALFFHLAFGLFIFFWVGAIVVIGFIFGLLGAAAHNKEASGLMIIFFILLYGSIFILVFLIFGLSIYMAIKAYQGNYSKYPVIGNIIYNRMFRK